MTSKGIILAGGCAARLHRVEQGVCKRMLPGAARIQFLGSDRGCMSLEGSRSVRRGSGCRFESYPEDISFRAGYVIRAQLEELARTLTKTGNGAYLLEVTQGKA